MTPDAREHAADVLEHPLALDRVALHDLPTPSSVSLPGLLMISLGTAILPDVVQQRAELQVAQRVGTRGPCRRPTSTASSTTSRLCEPV